MKSLREQAQIEASELIVRYNLVYVIILIDELKEQYKQKLVKNEAENE